MNHNINPRTWQAEELISEASMPDLHWSYSGKKSAHAEPEALTRKVLSASDVDNFINQLAKGPQENVMAVANRLIQSRSQAAIMPLIQIANGSRTKDYPRREAAILALGKIGGPQAAQGLMAIKKTPEYRPPICYALGQIRDRSALPYLIGLVRDGYPISFNLNLSPHDEAYLGVKAHAYALHAIGLIGDPSAIPYLVVDVNKEFLSRKYSDAGSDNLLARSSSFGLSLIGTMYDAWKNKRLLARSISIMVDPNTPLSAVLDFPGETRRMWMFQQRVTILKLLTLIGGIQPILNSLPQARQVIQRLMVALTMLEFDQEFVRWANIFAEGARSNNREERILAYDGFMRQYVRGYDPAIIPWGKAGLNDRDQTVRGAIASSILLNRAEALYPQTFEFLKSPSVDVRWTLVPPLMWLAIKKDSQAISILESMMKNDKDSGIRDCIADFWQDLPHAQMLSGTDENVSDEDLGEHEIEGSDSEPGKLEPSINIQSKPPPLPEEEHSEELSLHPGAIQPDEIKAKAALNLYCMMCGFKLSEAADFCPQCGERIE